MKKQFLFFMAMLLGLGHCIYGQSDQDNLDKYWAYRDRLVKNFLKVGKEQGESLPMSARRIGFTTYAETYDGEQESSFYWQDCNIYLGHYMAVLATEYKLLSNAGQDATQTLNEIYYCLATINRLDLNAEEYLSQGSLIKQPSHLNGYLLRDDVKKQFGDQMMEFCSTDYSFIFSVDANFNRMKGDFYGIEPNGDEMLYNSGNCPSIDQLLGIMMGLVYVDEMVGSVLVQPTDTDEAMNINVQVESITVRIITYLNDMSWRLRVVQGQEGCGIGHDYVCNGGSNVRFWAYPIIEMAKRILEQQNYVCGLNSYGLLCDEGVDLFLENSADVLCNIVDKLQNVPEVLQNWLDTHACQTGEGSEDVFFQTTMPNVGYKKLWQAMELGNIPYNTNIHDWIVNVLEEAPSVVLDIDFCIVNPEFTFSGGQINFEFGPCTPHQVRLTLDLGDFDFLAKPFDEDNVHMMLDAAVLGNVWGSAYVANNANLSGAYHIALADHVLNGYSITMSSSPVRMVSEIYSLFNQLYGELPPHLGAKAYFKDRFISTAPLAGPFAHPEELYVNSGPIWASANKLFHFHGQENGPVTDSGDPNPDFRGEFNGLDFMLYYNLYHLVWENDLPLYKRDCKCNNYQQEITSLSSLTEVLEVKRKFPDYKAKQIPIPSFLHHNLNVTGESTVLHVKNDLIICSPDMLSSTTLQFNNLSRMNLYDGNTVTVREGHKIIVGSGASIVAGLTDTDYAGNYPVPTIDLLANAQLIIQAGAKLLTKKGLVIKLGEGSKFTIDGGQCKPELLSDLGITIINHGGTVEVINGGILRTRNNSDMYHSFINATVTLDDAQWICENPSNTHAWYFLDSEIATYHNSLIVMNGEMHLDHSTLTMNHLSDLKINEGGIDVLEGSRLNWNGDQVELIGHLSHITFDGGQMEIGANKVFAPAHLSMPSGYMEFKSSWDEDLYMHEGSRLVLTGDGIGDIMLKIDGADLWTQYLGPNPTDINADHGAIELRNCKVVMDNGGSISTDFSLDAQWVHFVSNTDQDNQADINIWYEPHVNFSNCQLERVKFYGIGAHFDAFSSSFSMNSDVRLQYGHYALQNCNFNDSEFKSDAANMMCEMSNCQFDHASVEDYSLVELKVYSCDFYECPVVKNDGILSLQCNRFEETDEAVLVSMGFLNMSSASAAGYNRFYNVETCIELDRASGIDLFEGYNDLSGYTQFCIHGSLNWPCNSDDCIVYLKSCSHNYWGSSEQDPYSPDYFYGPDHPNVEIELYARDEDKTMCNILSENGYAHGCDVIVLDPSPDYITRCGNGKPVVRDTSKDRRMTAKPLANVSAIASHMQLRDLVVDPGNPIINTANFSDCTLDSALVAAACIMECYDSLGNDAQAIELFYEILTSGLDRSNRDVRWRMEWGRQQMKTAMESMFVDQELTAAANSVAFEPAVWSYAQVLNLMTDTLLTDSTYKDQFYVELDKGQLFRTIGQPVIAKYIFEHLGDCQLDSLEQVRLNQWQYTVDMELATRYAYENDSIQWDSLSIVIDTTLYPQPIDVSQSNYYFGVWIGGPQDVSFVNCGNDAVYRSLQQTAPNWSIYPNPSSDHVMIYCPQDEQVVICLLDAMGRVVMQRSIVLGDQHRVELPLDASLSAGSYLLSKSAGGKTSFQRLVIVR